MPVPSTLSSSLSSFYSVQSASSPSLEQVSFPCALKTTQICRSLLLFCSRHRKAMNLKKERVCTSFLKKLNINVGPVTHPSKAGNSSYIHGYFSNTCVMYSMDAIHVYDLHLCYMCETCTLQVFYTCIACVWIKMCNISKNIEQNEGGILIKEVHLFL